MLGRELTPVRNSRAFTASARAPRGRTRHARRLGVLAGVLAPLPSAPETLPPKCPARRGIRVERTSTSSGVSSTTLSEIESSERGLAVIVISSCGAYHGRRRVRALHPRRTVSTTEAPRWSWRGLSVTSRSPRFPPRRSRWRRCHGAGARRRGSRRVRPAAGRPGAARTAGEWRTWVSTSRASCLSPVPVAIAAETSASTVTARAEGLAIGHGLAEPCDGGVVEAVARVEERDEDAASTVATLVLLADADASATGSFRDIVDIGDAHPCLPTAPARRSMAAISEAAWERCMPAMSRSA